MALQLLVFDTRRGNKEGEEDGKVLAGYPDSVSLQEQSSMAGLLQGLLLFTANFKPSQGLGWDVAETDSGVWVMLEAEPHIWFAALAPRDWLPRHSTEASLRALLTQLHLLTSVLCGSVQAMLDQNPSGRVARGALHAVLRHVGGQLCSPYSWHHRELRNPLGDAALPPVLQLSPGAAVAVQSVANNLLLAGLAGQPRPVRGLLLLHGPHLLWSTLSPHDTAAVFALLATGLLHAPSTSRGGRPGGGGGRPGSPGAAPLRPGLRALDGSWWQQLPSGFLVQRATEGGLGAAAPGPAGLASGEAGSAVPLVHLQHGPMGQGQQGQEQGGAGGQSDGPGAYPLLPLLEGRLLAALLLDPGAAPGAALLGGLHQLVAAPAAHLAALVGEEVRSAQAEACHLPGFRYLFRDEGRGVCAASPRAKVSATSHHARSLAAAARSSLGQAAPQQPETGACTNSCKAHQAGLPDEEGSEEVGGGPGQMLEMVCRSSQGVWAYAAQRGDGRSLLAVRERRSERGLPEAAAVMRAFAETNFLL